MGRKVPLEVYGPKGIKAMTDHILAAWQADIDERISTETWQSGNYRDTHPGRMRPLPLIQQHENCCPSQTFGARRQQSKISHRVPALIENMLHEKAHEFLIRVAFVNELLISSVLRQIVDLMTPDPCHSVLGDRRSSDVSAIMPKPIRLWSGPADKNVPCALVLCGEQVPDLLTREAGSEHVSLVRFCQKGYECVTPGAHQFRFVEFDPMYPAALRFVQSSGWNHDVQVGTNVRNPPNVCCTTRTSKRTPHRAFAHCMIASAPIAGTPWSTCLFFWKIARNSIGIVRVIPM
jgi:hypothetical protein